MTVLGERNHDNLFAGGVSPVVTAAVTLLVGQSYVRGSVLGINTDGKATLVDSVATGDESTPYAILSEDVDATEADAPGGVYLTGEFNSAALTFGGTDTTATHKTALRNIGLFVKENQEA